MKAQTPYGPLFRNECGMDHAPWFLWMIMAGLGLGSWLLVANVPALILYKTSGGDLPTFFASFGDLVGFVLVWWLLMVGWFFAFALFPGFSAPTQNVRAFEFIFTRAVDRRRLLRARFGVIYLALLGPLVVNLVLVAFAPAPVIGTEVKQPGARLERVEQYRETFPGVREVSERETNPFLKIPVPHGGLVFGLWVFSIGAGSLLLMQGYCAWLAPRVPRNLWLAGLALSIPVLVGFWLAPWVPRHFPEFYEESFLWFGRRLWLLIPVLLGLFATVQWYCERKFIALEIH